jgi:hypothetical protein
VRATLAHLLISNLIGDDLVSQRLENGKKSLQPKRAT